LGKEAGECRDLRRSQEITEEVESEEVFRMRNTRERVGNRARGFVFEIL
jgi:hypothetical protein